MAYEDAKRLLQHADTFSRRAAAIEAALAEGMPLNEIEQYLDWLDNATPHQDGNQPDDDLSGDQGGPAGRRQ